MDTDEKVRENRVRRAAERQGYRVTKSRRRDPRAVDYGKYWVVDGETSANLSGQFGWTLGDVEDFLVNGFSS